MGKKNKKKSGSYIYDEYYAYFSNEESKAYQSDYEDFNEALKEATVDDDYYDDYYFLPQDVTTSTSQTFTTTIKTTRRPTTRKPKTQKAFSNQDLIAAPRPPNYAW